jgi:uncharacterized protein (TIGR00369 family)
MENNGIMTLRFLAEPTDVNFRGNVHGGTVMKWIDQVGYSCAVQWSGSYCVTVHVGAIKFFRPVKIGSLVELTAKIIHTGRTSMHIWIEVKSGTLESGTLNRTTSCFISFVSVDENGKPIPVKQFEPISEKDKKMEQFAKNMIDSDKKLVDEIENLF